MKLVVAGGGVAAATQIDKTSISKKVEDLTGVKMKHKKPTNEITPPVVSDKKVKIKDGITGYTFEASMNDFWTKVTEFNNMAENEVISLDMFFTYLLDKGPGWDVIPIYEDMEFGELYNGFLGFKPKFINCDIDGDMQPIYVFEYEYKCNQRDRSYQY